LIPGARPPTTSAEWFSGQPGARCTKATPLTDPAPATWLPKRAGDTVPWPVPPLPVALVRGLCMHCPACGQTPVFDGYLKVVPACSKCGAPLGLARADDAPPYFTIVVVGHIIVAAMWSVERAYHPSLWLHAAIWLPLTVLLSLALLRPIKGATVGLMLKLGMLKSGSDE
jgi:uncharacterized protein (DUF983 family)